MVLPFLALYMIKMLGFSEAEAGFVLSLYGLGGLLIAPVAGKLSDKLGALRLMRVSLFFSGLLLFAYSLITNYYLILGFTLMWSVISESFRPANLSMISNEAATGERKIAFALNRLAVNLGMSIGPVVGGFLSTINFHLLFYVDGLTSILAALYLFFSHFEIKHVENDPRELQTQESSLDEEKIPEKYKGVFNDKKFLLFLISLLPVTLVFFQLFGAVPIYLVNQLGFKESFFGLLMAVNTVMIIFIEVPLNNALSKWDDRKAISLGALLCGIGFGGMAITGNVLFVVLTVIIWTFGEMIFFPATTSYVSSLSPENRRGEYMGYFQMTFSMSLMIGPWIGTEVLENFGHIILWSGAFVLCLITVLVFLKRTINLSRIRKMPNKTD